MLRLRSFLIVAILGVLFILAQNTPFSDVPAQTTVDAPPADTEGTTIDPRDTEDNSAIEEPSATEITEEPSPTDVEASLTDGGGSSQTDGEENPPVTDGESTAPAATDAPDPTQTEGPSAPASSSFLDSPSSEVPSSAEVKASQSTDVEAPKSTEVDDPATTEAEAAQSTDVEGPISSNTEDSFPTDSASTLPTDEEASLTVTEEPTATETEDPQETEFDSALPSETGDEQSSETQSSEDNDEPTETQSGDSSATETASDEPMTTEADQASATSDDSEQATSTDKANQDDDDDNSTTKTDESSDKSSKTSSSGASNTNKSGDGGAGIVAIEADSGVESKKETPPDITTAEQHEAEAQANLPHTAIAGTDAEEVVILEAVMFDHFASKAPAPADVGTIEISSNVSSCKVGLQKRSSFGNRALTRMFGRELREGCKYVTSLEFDVYFNYIRSASDSERPNKLQDRVKNGVDLLNEAYGGLDINFNYKAYQQWAPPDSGSNKDWSKVTQFEDRLEKWLAQTRTGDEMTLNVWLVNDLRSNDGDKELNGYSSFPWDKKGPLDGIVLREDRISQDSVPTFIHEVGHWLGLRHTFREQVDKTDEDCKAADTLIDSSITTGLKQSMYECSQITCSDVNKDVINYMSYSQCRGKVPKNSFSTDQKSSIFSRVIKYRRGYRDGECTATITDSTKTKKMKKRSTMQDIVDGSCPNIGAGVQDLESQPTSTDSAGSQMGFGLGSVFFALAGWAIFIL